MRRFLTGSAATLALAWAQCAPAMAQTAQQAIGVALAAKPASSCNVPTPPTVAGINACIAKLSGTGDLYIPDSRPNGILVNSTTGQITQAPGIKFHGICPPVQFSGNVPDSFWTLDPSKGGSVFVGDGSLNYAFVYNNTPQASPYPSNTQFATSAIATSDVDCFGFKNIGFRQSGATNIMGLMMSRATNLYIYGAPAWALQDTNFMHAEYSRIYAREAVKGCYDFVADVSSTAILIPGNSYIEQTYCIAPSNGDLRSQCVQFMSSANNASLNEMYGVRIQCNMFNRTAYSGTATMTSGNANIAVPDGTQFTYGSLVRFSSNCGGLSAGKEYVVLSVSGNTIQVANGMNASGGLTPSATCSPTITNKGMPAIQVARAFGSTGGFNISLHGTDTEGIQAAAFYVEGAQGFLLDTDEIPSQSSYTDATVIYRNSYFNRSCITATSGGGTYDIDAGSAPVTWVCGGQYGVTGNGYYPVGITYGAADNIGRLSLGAGTSVDLEGRQPSAGASYIYPVTGIAQHVNTYQTGSVTLTPSMLGVNTFTGSSASTFTLPSITAASEKTSLVGIAYEIVNAGSATLTVATDGTQVFNGVAAKTTTTVPAGQTLKVTAMQTGASTYGWLAMPGGALN